jgi:cytochrome c553
MSRSRLVGLVASVAIAAAGLAHVSPANAEGDAAHGKVLAYTCLGCHGIPNYKNVYPTYSVPELRGQHAEYIVTALKAYRSGERGHPTMHAHASTLSEQDMQDVAAYLGGEAIKTATAGAAPDSAGMPPAVATCAACHGHNGVGIMGIYPTLSGQHADYLEHSLTAYRTGARKNGIMAPFAAQLKPEEIKQVAEYFAAQKPALQTVPRRENILRAKVN